jgi:hypothetical protein
MASVAAIEEMYLIYQAFSSYLTGTESLGDFEPSELMAAYRSFCQREPIGGMFLESITEEILDRVLAGGSLFYPLSPTAEYGGNVACVIAFCEPDYFYLPGMRTIAYPNAHRIAPIHSRPKRATAKEYMTTRRVRKTKLMRGLEEKFQRPLERLLPEIVNQHVLATRPASLA